MAIEAQIEQLSGLITTLIAKLDKLTLAVAPALPGEPAVERPAKAAKVPKEKPAADAPTAKEVASAVIELAAISRDDAVAALAQFKVARATELKPDNYAAFLRVVKAKLAEKAKPLEGEEDGSLV